MQSPQARKEAVVVSGASRGVGHATALALVQAGYRVYAGVLSTAEAASWNDEATGRGQLVPVALDVTRPADIAAVADRVAADGLPLRALVNVAGIARFDVQQLVDPLVLRRMFEVNVFGTRDLCAALLDPLKRSRGRLVFVTSMAARTSMPFIGAYAATKTAMEFLADAMRVELRPWGVSVALLEPGGIRTEMTREALVHLESEARRCDVSDDLRPYAAGYAFLAASIRRDLHTYLSPETVADRLVALTTATNVPARTVLGRDAKAVVLLRKLLPDAWLDALLARQVRIARP